MLDSILIHETTAAAVGTVEIGLCTIVALILGFIIACVYMYKNNYSKNFVVTIVILPVIIQALIMLVNGNLGTGVAVLGAFSLIRFRSAPGSAKDITSIFFSMAVGIAVGMGYLVYAAVFTAVVSLVLVILSTVSFGETNYAMKNLKITIPENLDYTEIFDEIFRKYTKKTELHTVRTTNLGSLYELQYTIQLKDVSKEKEFIDELRCRNGNLNISCGRVPINKDEL